MDIEYLEYELEVIDLDESSVREPDPRADETGANAIFECWFTDWRGRDTTAADTTAR